MLYPPILASTQEVFTPSTGDLVVNFSLASITAPSDIKHIGILVVKQNNNKSIANTTRYPDGVIYKNYTEGMTSVTINTTDDLGETWELGCLYKIQLRFGRNTLCTSDFATWHATQVEENAFSEWSTAMIVKPITKPSLTLAANGTVIEDSPTTITTIVSLTPTFQGTTDYNNRANEKEKEEKFCFELYQGTNLIETTGWQLHTGNEDIGYFKTMLRNQGTYKIRYRTLSTNGYELDSNYINFIAVQTSIEVLEHISIALTRFSTNPDSEKKEEEDKEFLAQEKVYRVENGCVRIYIQSDSTDLVNGNFVIVHVPSFKSSKLLCGNGRTKWCITREESYFRQYVTDYPNRDQYFLFDFNRKESDAFAHIGFTMENGRGFYCAQTCNNCGMVGSYTQGNESMNINQALQKASLFPPHLQ